MASPRPVSTVLNSPVFNEEPLDEKFKILDEVRTDNLEHLSEQNSAGEDDAARYAARVERQNARIRDAKKDLVQTELQGKLESWAIDNDSSIDAARDTLVRAQNGEQSDIPETLSQILNWGKEKHKEIEDSSRETGFSAFNNLQLETDQGNVFGEGRIFQSSNGQTQAAISFYNDKNGQRTKEHESVMVKLPDDYDSSLKDLNKRKLELEQQVLDDKVQVQEEADMLKKQGMNPGDVESHALNVQRHKEMELELTKVSGDYARYTDGLRGRSEFFKDKLDERVRSDSELRERMPQGSNWLMRPVADSIISMIQNQQYMKAGMVGLYGSAVGDKGAMRHAAAMAKDADDMGIAREMYGMGQTRHNSALWAQTATLLSEELPDLAIDVLSGTAIGLMTKGATKAVAEGVYKNAFKDQLADPVLKALAEEAKGTLIENVSRRWGSKVSTAIEMMPSAAQDAASNLSSIYDKVDSLNAESAKLEAAGDVEGAKAKSKEAVEIEGNAATAFMAHFGSSATLEFLPLERILRRNEKALDMTEHVFAAAERQVKGATVNKSLQAGVDRAAAFRSAIEKWADSRFGTRIMEALKGGSQEALTEVLQAMSDNKIAAEFYDDNRDLLDGVVPAAAGGLIMGGLVNFVATRTDKAALERVVNNEISAQDQANKSLTESVAAIPGKPIGGVVAASPKEVVQKVGATYRIVDPDMPQDHGVQNIEFNSADEAEAFAAHRWEQYATNKINSVISQRRDADGNAPTKEDIAAETAGYTVMTNSIAKLNGVSRESVWKSLASSVEFMDRDPSESALDGLTEDDVVASLDSLKEYRDTNPVADGELKPGFYDDVDRVINEYQQWKALPEDQRGARPTMRASTALAVGWMHDLNKKKAAYDEETAFREAMQNQPTDEDEASNPPEGQNIPSDEEMAKDDEERAVQRRDADAEAANPTDSLLSNHWLQGDSPYGHRTEPGKRYTPEQKRDVRKKAWEKTKDMSPKDVADKIVEQKREEYKNTPRTPWWKSSLNHDLFETHGKGAAFYNPKSEQDARDFLEKKFTAQQQALNNEFQNAPPDSLAQETPFQVWKSSVRRSFAPSAKPSEVELTEAQRLQEVFGEDAPVNEDGTLDVIGALEHLSKQEGPMGELAGLLSDILPTLNLSNQKLRYRMSDELDSSGVTSPANDGDMMVGQSDKSTTVGQNTGVVEFLHHMVTDTIGVLLDNYTASVGTAISQRGPLQKTQPPGTLVTNFKPGALAAENTPAGIEARVAYETAMPFAMVQRDNETGQAYSSAQSSGTMKQMFVFNELSEVLGGRPHKGLVQAVVNGAYSYGEKRPTDKSQHGYYLQTTPDGRVVAWSGGARNWSKMPFQQDDKAYKKYKFDTGWESRLARLYVREVMTSGMYDQIFNPEKGVAGTKLSRSEYLAQYGPQAPNYHLTSFSRFVQGVIMDPMFAMRVSKARYGFPAINVKDMVFGDVVNNAFGARTMEPDPIKRFSLARSLSLGQQVEASKIPALSTVPALAGGPGGVDSRVTPGPRISQAAFPDDTSKRQVVPSIPVKDPEKQDATGFDRSGERTSDQREPSEAPLNVPAEMAADSFGRPLPSLSEGEGRAMYKNVGKKPSQQRQEDFSDAAMDEALNKDKDGEDGPLTESDDATSDEVDEMNSGLDEEAGDYYDTSFEAIAEKAAEEDAAIPGKLAELRKHADVVSRAITALGMGPPDSTDNEQGLEQLIEASSLSEGDESTNPMGAIDFMVVNPTVTVEKFDALIKYLRANRDAPVQGSSPVEQHSVAQRTVKGTRSAGIEADLKPIQPNNEVTDKAIDELAGEWLAYRVPAAVAVLKESSKYKAADQKERGQMYREAVAAVTPVGMTKAQSASIGAEYVPDTPLSEDEQKKMRKEEKPEVKRLIDAPIKGVSSNQVLAVTGEDPVSVLLAHVRSLDPARLSAAHDIMVALSEEFGFQLSDELENSLGQIRVNPQDGATWLAAERVLSALRASKNPVSVVESLGGDEFDNLHSVLWGLAQNPQLLQDAHALATSFVDSVALKFGEMGFVVKTKEVEDGERAPKQEPAMPGEDAEVGNADENKSGFVTIQSDKRGPRPGPSNEFTNRTSRYNIPNKGGNSTRLFPVGLRPYVMVNGKRMAISDSTRWSKLDNKSVKEVYEEVAEVNPDATTEELDKLYYDVWKRALSGPQGLDALTEMKKHVQSHRKENGTDLPLVSTEASEARTSSPAIAISKLLNTQLDQSGHPFELNSQRRGYIDTSTRMITILKAADPTTFIHELTHWFRETKNANGESMFDVALGPNKAAFMAWVTQDGTITDNREIEERVAEGLTSYLAENRKKPFLKKHDKKVQNAFKRLAQLFRDTYAGLAPFMQIDARARKGFDQVFSNNEAEAPVRGSNPNLTVTQMNEKRGKLVDTLTDKYGELFYKSLPRVVEPYEDWKASFKEDVHQRGQYLNSFVKFLENQGILNNEDASLLRWVPAFLPGMADDEEVNEMLRAAQQAGLNAPTKEGVKDALAQEANAPRQLMPRTITEDSTQYPGDPVTLQFPSSNQLNQTGPLRVAMRLKGKSFARWWKANGNAPWVAFNSLLERNGQKSSIERDMVKIMKMAEDAIEKGAWKVGLSNAQANRHAANRALNAYLIEQDPVVKHQLLVALPSSELKRAALRMRQYVDGLSVYLTATGVVRGPLASAINNKIGFYLHRSYQINSDPGWKDHMLNGALKPLWEKAIDVIERTRGISRNEAYDVGHDIMRSMGFANKPENGGTSVDATILMSVSKEFADVQKAADMILGLREDPIKNFTKTVEGMAQLIANHEFIQKILKDGVSQGWVRAKNDPTTAQNRHLNEAFFGDTTPVDPNLWLTNPALAHQKTAVAGYYTTPEISQWMTDVMSAQMPTNAAHRMVNSLNGLFKTSNTVHNWVSGLRNIYSATVGVWGQGHTGRYLATASRLVFADSKSNGPLSPQDEALMKELFEHNIAESATMAELKDFEKRGYNLDEANKQVMGPTSFWSSLLASPVKYANKLNPFKTTTYGAPAAGGAASELAYRTVRGLKKYDSVRKKIYGGTDTVAKIAAYLEEKDRVKSMFPNMTPKEIRAEAARRTHMTMFSFDMLPKAVNEFRTGFAGLLWGPFVSFPYSMARTYVNTMAIGYTDMSEGYKAGGVTNKQFRDGCKRLGALTAMSWGVRAAVIGVNKALGWEEEEEVAARKLLAPWDQDGNIMFLSRPGGVFSYINLSSIMPYSYVTDAVSALVSGSATKDSKTVIDPVVEMMKQIVKPFTATQFFLDAVGNEAKNTDSQGKRVWIDGDTMGNNLGRVSGAFFSPLLWGDVRNLVRLGVDPGNMGRFLGAKHNKDMDGWSKAAYAAGFKVSTVNVENQFKFQVEGWIRQYKSSTIKFHQDSTSPNPVAHADLVQGVTHALQQHAEITRAASMQMNALMTKFGLPEDVIIESFDKTTLRDDVGYGKLNDSQKQAIWDGEWVEPITISEQHYYSIDSAAEKAGQPERMLWLDDLMEQGLLDVKSGR